MFDVEQAPVVRTRAHALDLSILIVTWNSARWIERCVRSLPAATEGLSYELFVFDNASDDDTLPRLRDVQATVFRAEQNEGLARATNKMVEQSRGRFVFLMNPDCELEPGALTKLCQFLQAHPNAAAAAPQLVDESGGSQRDFQLRRLPTLRGLAAEALFSASGLDRQLAKFLPKSGFLNDLQASIVAAYNEASGIVEPTAQLSSRLMTEKLKLELRRPYSGRGTRAFAEYQVGKRFSAVLQWDDQQAAGPAGNLGLDLKLRWEIE